MTLWPLTVLLLLAGCKTPLNGEGETLRVGVSSDYPPIVFTENSELQGVEIDLGLEFQARTGRKVEFVEVPWEEQINSVIEGRTDIIMSGMSITPERAERITFSVPYLSSGLLALRRVGNSTGMKTSDDIRASAARIGVQPETTAYDFVKRECSSAKIVLIDDANDAVGELDRRNIDLFVHDSYLVGWLIKKSEVKLVGIWLGAEMEEFGWGMRKEDRDLHAVVNDFLRQVKDDGTLENIRAYWME